MSVDAVEDFRPRSGHWLTRTLVLRALGLIYAVAFAIAIAQLEPLMGEHGLLPVHLYLAELSAQLGGATKGFLALPSLFWLGHGDGVMLACAWLGLCGALAVIAGATNAVLMALLWALYLSFVHVGQEWYGYGWEILLLEAGFLAIFYCPIDDWRPFSPRSPPPALVTWLFRFLAFRLMLGAGLIKIRGDACWRDLTCMSWHYETQPNPSPLSWLLHQLPPWFHTLEVGFNHIAELLVPPAVFLPRPYRSAAGIVLVAFQLLLIASGNLSFLNWLTLAVCLACFDDEAIARAVPSRHRTRLMAWLDTTHAAARAWPHRRWVLAALGLTVAVLAIDPLMNMMSPRQAMNRSFDRLHLVNTYGAFGSVSRERDELVIQGSDDAVPGPATMWRDYELPCKPTRLDRRPCLVTPYHYRLDWQMWWPFNDRGAPPWLVHLLFKLLHADRVALSLVDHDPFAGARPRWLRVMRYRYRFTTFGEPGWWQRELVAEYIRPVSLSDGALLDLVARQGWGDPSAAPQR